MIAWASPPCHECGDPVQRVEHRNEHLPGGEWVPTNMFMVCANGHRVPVAFLP